MRGLQKSCETIEECSYLYPAIADQVMEVFTKGVNHWMRPLKVPVNEADTLPHQQKMANLIVRALRGGVKEGFFFVRHRNSIPKNELISPTHTGVVVKSNPDMTISEKWELSQISDVSI